MHHSPTRGSIILIGAMIVALTACDLFEPPRRNLRVSLVTPVAIPAARLHVRIALQRVVLRADAVGETSKQLTAPRDVSLPVNVALLDFAEDTLARVEFRQRFGGSDDDHWVLAVIGVNRPIGFCIGSLAMAALPTGSDTLFVMYGHIPRDAIC